MLLYTAEQIAEMYDVSVSSIKTQFPRTCANLMQKKGVCIQKEGRGAKAMYRILNFEHADPDRAVSLYKSLEKNSFDAPIAAGLLDMPFLVFIGIVSSPNKVFRGNYAQFLEYLELPVTEDNINVIRNTLAYLVEQGYLMFQEDPSDNSYFMASVLRITEIQMQLEINAVLYFRNCVADTRKSWIPLMKTYIAVSYLQQPCTITDLMGATGLSEYKVRDCLDILSKKKVIMKEKVVKFKDGNFRCYGQDIDVNAFWDIKIQNGMLDS